MHRGSALSALVLVHHGLRCAQAAQGLVVGPRLVENKICAERKDFSQTLLSGQHRDRERRIIFPGLPRLPQQVKHLLGGLAIKDYQVEPFLRQPNPGAHEVRT